MSERDLLLSIDLGTGSARAAICDLFGNILSFAAREHDQIVPRFGWGRTAARRMVGGCSGSVREVLGTVENARERIAGVAVCGQQLGTVLIDDDGELVLDRVPLWNDKRGAPYVHRLMAENELSDIIADTGNPPATTWSAFKLWWIARTCPMHGRARRRS